MDKLPPNLFASLFHFHPREDHTPKENVLTEAFAYLLRTDQGVLNCWLSILLDKTIKDATCDITTQQTEKDLDADTLIFSDLLIDGQLSDGEVLKYRKVAEKRGTYARL